VRLRAGQALRSVTDMTAVIVIRAADRDVRVTCGGAPMVESGSKAGTVPPLAGHGDGTLLGKRYEDTEATVELLCTKGGTSSLAIDGVLLTVKAAKPLPASD
jgi:hypothetical protein